jgi:hypothetical protein
MLISRAPVRISFFGGGTDYPEYFLQHGGSVLATAIDKFSYVTASPFLSHLFDYSVRVSYRKVELVKTISEMEHRVFRECLKFCELEKDIELLLDIDPNMPRLGHVDGVRLKQILANLLGNFGAEYPAIICTANSTKGIEMMLGNGGGSGIIKPKAKIIIAKPKPTECMASTKSLTRTLSREDEFTTSSNA